MDSPTSFDDDDESFFANYAVEQANVHGSRASHGFDEADTEPPTREELAHLTRFRRPVALVVASMALLSIVALGTHGVQQHGSRRELVAHYDSALPAPALAASATVEQAGPALVVSSVGPEAPSSLVPEALSALIADALSALVPDASAATSTATPARAITDSGPAPDPVLTEIFSQPDSNLDAAFLSAPPPMCVLPAAGGFNLAHANHAGEARAPLATSPRRSRPATSANATSVASAPKPPATFNSVARFSNLRR